MLTLKLLREQPELVIEKLAKKQFDARGIVTRINELDANRRALQLEIDACNAEQKKAAALIGGYMKEGRKAEAEAAKAEAEAALAEAKRLREAAAQQSEVKDENNE